MAQRSNNTQEKTYRKLSIQVSLSGLSFCVLDPIVNKISAFEQFDFEKKLNPFEVLERLINFFDTKHYLQDKFDVLIIHENDLSTLVPEKLFDEAHLADYLKFNSKILKTDFISFENIKLNQSVNVYVPYININNYIFETHGEFTYKHSSTILINTVLSNHIDTGKIKLYIHVSNNHFEIIAVEQSNLTFYNSFEFKNKEDFIYYLLFVIEQLNYDPETIELIFLGAISEDSNLYKITYKYIRHIAFYEKPNPFNFPKDKETKLSNFIITNSF